MRGGELASRALALAERRAQSAATRDADTGQQAALCRVGDKLRHDRGGYRCKNVRINRFEQLLREVGVAGVQLELNACAEKRKSLE